ncbi:amidohydrolase family protein [Roseibacterium beibuensis]|uniref:amidohydrolase family protein n=1 Tax=[Roseibacterium] beibuensis TaxID=1193142 RepID=UPI00217CDE55|nr:amidohydrolase family protein [Roseibacterium beibuensis]MCS6625413.1 amidohydrolase family protein [Roseibacterium beibuensis]
MRWLARTAACIFLGFASSLGAAASAQQGAGGPEPVRGVAVVGVQVLPMSGPDRLADQTVLIVGDRITAVGPSRDLAAPSGFQVIDGAGMTLMPGLVDMHVHVANTTGAAGDPAQRALDVMIAHGVTTARSMAGAPSHVELRAALERGDLPGPRLYLAAPGLHDGNTPTTEAARQAVASARIAGFDFIKSHHLTNADVWAAVQDQARQEGLATAGHVTAAVGAERAARSGQQIEHLDGLLPRLLPADHPVRGIEYGQIAPPPVIEFFKDVSESDIVRVAEEAAASGGWHVPTLSLFEKVTSVERSNEDLAADPDMRFVPPQALAQWGQQRQALLDMGFQPEHGATFRDLRRRLVSAMARAGVPIMAGSDTAQGFQIWGVGLIEEIKTLNAAGLSPMQALRAATATPARYFQSLPNQGSSQGWPANFGTIEPGARADLILLGADPSRDLGALDDLRIVIKGGRVIDRAALDGLLAQAEQDVRTEVAQTAPKHPVYVMRHLEAGAGEDPGLSASGASVARAMVDQFAPSGITTIYVTDTRRSIETAAPLAEHLGLTPVTYDPRDPAGLAREVAASRGPVLIIGHSNTIDDLVRRVGGTGAPASESGGFGKIWRVGAGGAQRVLDAGTQNPAAD